MKAARDSTEMCFSMMFYLQNQAGFGLQDIVYLCSTKERNFFFPHNSPI
jgi:hypothetical protein